MVLHRIFWSGRFRPSEPNGDLRTNYHRAYSCAGNLTDPGPMAPQHDQSVQQQIPDLLDHWRHIHQGTLAGLSLRRRTAEYFGITEQWISPALNTAHCPHPLIWKCSMSSTGDLEMLLPSFENALQAIALVVEKYNYPGQIRGA